MSMPRNNARNKLVAKRGPQGTPTAAKVDKIKYLWREVGRVIGHLTEKGELPENVSRDVERAINMLSKIEVEPDWDEIFHVDRYVRIFDYSVDRLCEYWDALSEPRLEREAKEKIARLLERLGEVLGVTITHDESDEFLLPLKSTKRPKQGNPKRAALFLKKYFPKGKSDISDEKYFERKKLGSMRVVGLENGYYYNLCALDPDKDILLKYMSDKARARDYFDYCCVEKENH